MVYVLSSEVMMVMMFDGCVIDVNLVFIVIMGYLVQEFKGQFSDIICFECNEWVVIEVMCEGVVIKGMWSGEYLICCKDGSEFFVLFMIDIFVDSMLGELCWVVFIYDMMEKKCVEEVIWWQVNFDVFIDLFNWYMFYNCLCQEIVWVCQMFI